MDMKSAPIGIVMYQIRLKRGLSVEKLAERSGLSATALRKWETGNKIPMLQSLRLWIEGAQLTKDEMAEVALAALFGPKGGRQTRTYNPPIAPPRVTDSANQIWLRKSDGKGLFHLYSDSSEAAACGVHRFAETTSKEEPRVQDRCYSCEKIRLGIPRNTKVGELGWY